MNDIQTIDQYISQYDGNQQVILQKIKSTIKSIIPNAQEYIKYGMPTFRDQENIIHFAGFKNHIGLYPTPSAIIAFKKELLPYKTSKGAIQFSRDSVPFELIENITKYRNQEIRKVK